jgi:hypothetical protein
MTPKIENRYDRNQRLQNSFSVFVGSLALALDCDFIATQDGGCFSEIVLRDGTKLSVGLNGYEGKVEVAVGSKRDSRNQLFTLRDVMNYEERNGATPITVCINVAAEGRTFKALAADITRRLLPDARVIWARICEAVKRSDDYASGCASEAEKFAELLDCPPHQNDARRAEKNFFPELPGVHCVTVAQGNVDFKFSGSPATAAKLLALLKELSAE